MTPEVHDAAGAVTSHLPHAAAAALAATVPETYFRLGGPGLLDSTRVAAGDPVLWRQIFSLNRDNLLTALERFGTKLSALHAALRDGDQEAVERLLVQAKKSRDALGS